MNSLNEVKLIGNLGKDPEIRVLENGTKVANFSIATSKRWKDRDSGEDRESTEWHNVQTWRGLAEVVEKYVKKGNKVYVCGELQTRRYEDKDGITRFTTTVIARDLINLTPREATHNEPAPVTSQDAPSEPGGDNDDLPF